MSARVSLSRIVLPMLPVLAVGLLASWGSWRLAVDSDEAGARQRFGTRVSDAVSEVRARMTLYEHLLRSGAGLYAASTRVDRSEWRALFSEMRVEEDFAGVQGYGVIRALEVERRELRAVGPGVDDRLPRAGRPLVRREPYAPIVHVEPHHGDHARRLGEDQYADPVRRAALERARDTGLPTLTAKLRFDPQYERPWTGVMLVLPVYRAGEPVDTVPQRRAALTGWIFCTLRMNVLTEALLGAAVTDMSVELYDGPEPRAPALLHALRADVMPAQYRPGFAELRHVEVAGVQWTLRFATLPAFDEGATSNKAGLVLAGGLATTLLMALLVAALSTTRGHALALAADMSRAHRDAEARTRAVLDHTAEAILTSDAAGHVLSINPAGEALFGRTAAEVVGQHMRMLLPERLREPTRAALEQLAQSPAGTLPSFRRELLALHANGAEIPVRLSIGMVQMEGERQFVALVTDISEQKRHAEQMMYMAHHDALTALPNRTLFNDRAEQAIALAARAREHVGILLIDLNRFKPINDTYGHLAGDIVLQTVASRLKDTLRASDTVARIGGDEFVVVLPMLTGPAGADEVAAKLDQALAPAMRVGAHELHVGASIGVAVYPRDGGDVQTLLRVADAAMYARKASRRDQTPVLTGA
jgi:diguanylate cyclase (GGDEF)-like protein/PAS domain S-box-containing protein